MDKYAFDPAEWDDVEEKTNVIRNLTVGEVCSWVVAGAVIIAGIWQAFQPINKYPEERRTAV